MKTKEIGHKLVLTWEKDDEIKIGETISIDLEETYKEGFKNGFTNCQKIYQPDCRPGMKEISNQPQSIKTK